jgi:L-fucose mutarotase/ribose pyranase (RbsD/FucU family)
VSINAFEVFARHRQDERCRARRDQQTVVRRFGAVVGDYPAAHAVDTVDRLAQMQRDVVFLIPLERVQHDVAERLLARQHRREQDAVVVRVRLRAEYRDVVVARRNRQQFFDRADAGHAVADHDETRFVHDGGLLFLAACDCNRHSRAPGDRQTDGDEPAAEQRGRARAGGEQGGECAQDRACEHKQLRAGLTDERKPGCDLEKQEGGKQRKRAAVGPEAAVHDSSVVGSHPEGSGCDERRTSLPDLMNGWRRFAA